jgi:prepilin-type N-terminal cleavage/methylation domain-containing protein
MRRAFTLIELIVALAVIAVLAGLVVPRASGVLDGIHLRGAVAEVVEAFAVARAVAIRESAFATIKIDSSTNAVYVQLGADTVLMARLGSRYGVTVRSNKDSMAFSPLGVGFGAGNQSVIVRLRGRVDTVVVSRLGRVRH